MTVTVFAVVVLAALLHATWNAIVKSGSDSFLDTILVNIGAAAVAILGIMMLPLPAPASWPYLLASAVIHVGYFLLVASAYRYGDLSFAYPLMRGTGPLLVSLTSAALIGESLGRWGSVGVALICLGLFGLAAEGIWRGRRKPGSRIGQATLFAFANGVVIALYTYCDGLGARLSGNPASYLLSMLLLTALPLIAWTWHSRGPELGRYLQRRWAQGLVGGICTAAAYGLAIWAMTAAPIALVAALRESSIVFATAIGGFWLRERIGSARLVAAAAVVGGATVIKLA